MRLPGPVAPSPAAAHAVRVATTLSAAHGLISGDPLVLADGASVVVHLRPHPVVAKVAASTLLVRPDAATWQARDLRVSAWLADAGVSVVRASDLLPPGPFERDATSVGFWEHLPHQPDAVCPPELFGELLAQLHAVLRECPERTEHLATPVEDLDAFLSGPWLGDRATAFAAAYAPVRDRLLPGAGQLLHGDAHPGNLLLGARGWVWSDLEDSCSGGVAWDLAAALRSSRFDGSRALAAYASASGDPLPDDLADHVRLRALHATAWYVLYAERLPHHRAEADRLLTALG